MKLERNKRVISENKEGEILKYSTHKDFWMVINNDG